MSVREYIGARYLPLFPDNPQWSSANTYEPLTVVQNLGSSYISRQYVPAGIQISNTDYWVLWADFNSQIEQYRAEVQAFDGRITANADDIDALEDRLPKASFDSVNTVAAAISANASDIDALENILPKSSFTSVNTVKSAIDTINNTINDDLLKDYAVFIGDSYLRGTGTTDGPSGGDGFSSIGNGWGKTLAAVEGISPSKVMCIAGGSGGFGKLGTNGGGINLNFSGMVQKAGTLMTAAQKKRVRYVIILGGINDGSDITLSQIDATVNMVRTTFPGVPLHIFTNMGNRTPRHNLGMGQAYAYNLIRERCALNGGSFHETWRLGLSADSIFNEDNLHLNDNGYTYLGRAMKAAIHGGEINPVSINNAGYVGITGETGVNVGSTPLYFDGRDSVTLSSSGFTIDVETLPITGSSAVKIASIPLALAPRFTVYGMAMLQGADFYSTGTFGLAAVEINGSGEIKLRRGFVVDTTQSTADNPIYTHKSFTGASKSIIVYMPTIQWQIF